MALLHLPEATVITDLEALDPFQRDESHVVGCAPLAVVRPHGPSALRELVRLARSEGFGLVPRGAGTGKAGGCVPTERTVVVDLCRLAGQHPRLPPGPEPHGPRQRPPAGREGHGRRSGAVLSPGSELLGELRPGRHPGHQRRRAQRLQVRHDPPLGAGAGGAPGRRRDPPLRDQQREGQHRTQPRAAPRGQRGHLRPHSSAPPCDSRPSPANTPPCCCP